jgi:hypothetical protein
VTHPEIAEFVAGALGEPERARVADHVAGCRACATELAAWRATARALREGVPEPPGQELVAGVLRRAALAPPRPVTRPSWRLAPQLVRTQVRLVGRGVWIASMLVMGLGAVLTLVSMRTSAVPGQVLALVAPVVAAGGVAGLYGPARDPGHEIVASTPAHPRLILLARLTLVVGYDVALALLASAVLALLGRDTVGLMSLVGAWLGPLALLTALSLVVGVRFGPDIAMAAALGLWALRLLDGTQLVSGIRAVTAPVAAIWSTRPLTFAIAAVLCAAGLVLADGRIRVARR